MRTFLVLGIVLAFGAAASAHDHGTGRCGLVGYGPVNPYKWLMTNDLYTTSMAPTFRDFRGGGIRAGVPAGATDRQPPATPRQGSKPSIVLPPPNPIPNPQLTPPLPPASGGSTSPVPPPPTPASVKPSSRGPGSGSR
jgi:hypothetical protein